MHEYEVHHPIEKTSDDWLLRALARPTQYQIPVGELDVCYCRWKSLQLRPELQSQGLQVDLIFHNAQLSSAKNAPWPQMLELVRGIEKAYLEPGLATQNVPGLWQKWRQRGNLWFFRRHNGGQCVI